MDDPVPPSPELPSSSSLPSSSIPSSSIPSAALPSAPDRQTRSKGKKARQQPADSLALPVALPAALPVALPAALPAAAPANVPLSTWPPSDQRGTKRREAGDVSAYPAASPSANDEEKDLTPRKYDAQVPRVQVDDASPPRPARRPKIVATGDVCLQLPSHLLPVLIPHSGQVRSLQEAQY